MTLTRTYTRTFNVVRFANPYLKCGLCDAWVEGWAPDSDAPGLLFPCEHYAGLVDVCPSWGPVDGCTCDPATHSRPERDA